MRIITLEEHFSLPFAAKRVGQERIQARGVPAMHPFMARLSPLLADIDAGRIADLDSNGISLQVMSSAGPGADLVDGEEGIALARDMNDALAAATAKHPGRLAGFAHLPMRSPEAAARELERCVRELGFLGALVSGTTDNLFLDAPRFEPILSAAEDLDVPVYLHPAFPPAEVAAIYYSNLPGNTGSVLATAGWGWHSEVALHVLRMVASGTFDKHRKLKLIVGHMGEGLPAAMERCDDVLGPASQHLTRGISQTILEQVWITTAGFLHQVPFASAMATFGPDRIMFSVDYPFTTNAKARPFLEKLPVSDEVRAKIAHGNAEKLLKLV